MIDEINLITTCRHVSFPRVPFSLCFEILISASRSTHASPIFQVAQTTIRPCTQHSTPKQSLRLSLKLKLKLKPKQSLRLRYYKNRSLARSIDRSSNWRESELRRPNSRDCASSNGVVAANLPKKSLDFGRTRVSGIKESSFGALSFTTDRFVSFKSQTLRFRKNLKIESLWRMRLKSSSTRNHFFSSQALVDLPAGGVAEVPLAQTGEGIAECELLKWFVGEGDHVEEFQPLCEVQSDKATMEITSRYKGSISKIFYCPGDIVKVGETLLKIVVDEAQTSMVLPDASTSTLPMGSDALESGTSTSMDVEHKEEGVLSTPAVRNLAKHYGININLIHGSGKDGRILKEDILKYACGKEGNYEELSASTQRFPPQEEKSLSTSSMDELHFEDKPVPLRGFQRSMVRSMALAAKVPHFHYLEEINCDALVELKAAFQNENSDPDVKHTYLPFLVKSLSVALNKYPLLNASFNEGSDEVILKGCHNIGIAMATPYGLVVPNIKKVQTLSVLEVTRKLSHLQHLALNNKLSSEDISGGTITVSNIGAVGGKYGSPLLNLPEVAIIAIGRIQRLPAICRRWNCFYIIPHFSLQVNIGADHRVVDGATVAKFCNEWKSLIENPELLLLHMR
ncbi:hypothetical protein Syun_028775 [Stephania yunnanensis]|uniref:Dihydrolipoamide acetyltransferase component of pyruvate dehydrogenase complex n=1 Tax=Stephania yunnanensis TaxID=152371 RepID=A0AAP0E4C0_9MAGN